MGNIVQKVANDEIYEVVATFFSTGHGHGGGGHSGKSWLSNDKSHNFELFLISCPYDIILGPHLLFKCA